MLNNFINQFKELFTSKNQTKSEENNPIPKQRENTRPFQAKVSYQYPENKSFKFPMQVDPPKTTRDKPARRKVVKVDQHQINNHGKTEREDVSKKEPFKMTEFASPIHGYQTHAGEKIEELEEPAFVRRDRRQLEERELPSQEDHVAIEPDVKKIELNNKDFSETARPIDESIVHKDEVKSEQVMEEKGDNQEGSRKKKMPFNVIMTPRDKKLLREKEEQRLAREKAKAEPNGKSKLPSLDLLNNADGTVIKDQAWIDDQSQKLTQTLSEFNVNAKVVNVVQGPTVTRFEIQPELGVKVSKVRNLSDDIKLNMAARDIRIEAPIPGKNAIGIEIPNKVSSPVGLAEIFKTSQFKNSQSPLTIGLGLDIAGHPVVTDINEMPHGLIAGATGSGKSVCINSILISLLYKATPEEVRLLLIDPKMVELAPFNDIPHLVSPVITDVKAATQALSWAVEEMELRYQKFVNTGSRDIKRYNQKMVEQGESEKMPYLVIVIDELADLMMLAPQDVEDSISRIAQKARACGIHLILATQRPSVDVITGLIKANIPTRIAFSVASQIDSRTMIDQNGAERLLGKGDMLFVESGARHPVRIQGAFVSDKEIERITTEVKKYHTTNYLFEQDDLLEKIEQEDNEDELYDEVVEFVLDRKSASTSLLQRQFRMGYNRAARLVDDLESNGIISGQNGSKPRTVLVSKDEYHHQA